MPMRISCFRIFSAKKDPEDTGDQPKNDEGSADDEMTDTATGGGDGSGTTAGS